MRADTAEKTQMAIAGRILELQRGMVDMSDDLGKKLKQNLPTLRIRNAQDFVALAELQRKLLDMPENVRLEIHDYSDDIARADKKVKEILNLKKGKKKA